MSARFAITSLRFRLRGVNLEKVLNAARKEGILLRDISREKDRALICLCKKRDAEALLQLCQRFSCRAEGMAPPPLSRLIFFFQKNKGFLAGMLLFFFLCAYAMQFTWGIRIDNAGAYAGDIRAYLTQSGIQAGVKRREIDLSGLQNDLEWRYPQLAWIRTSWQGAYLSISVTQGVLSPQVETSGPAGDVVASQDAVIESIVTLAGTPLVKPGDFVRAGDVLIQGSERTQQGNAAPVKARGTVTGRVWIEESIVMQGTEDVALPTGKSCCQRILCTPFGCFTRHAPPSFSVYDTEITHHVLGGAWLPVYLTMLRHEEAVLERRPLDIRQLERDLALAADQILMQKVQKNDVVVDKWVDYSMIDVDRYAATAAAEIRREIGRFQPHGS